MDSVCLRIEYTELNKSYDRYGPLGVFCTNCVSIQVPSPLFLHIILRLRAFAPPGIFIPLLGNRQVIAVANIFEYV
jgi:hypothetical protein